MIFRFQRVIKAYPAFFPNLYVRELLLATNSFPSSSFFCRKDSSHTYAVPLQAPFSSVRCRSCFPFPPLFKTLFPPKLARTLMRLLSRSVLDTDSGHSSFIFTLRRCTRAGMSVFSPPSRWILFHALLPTTSCVLFSNRAKYRSQYNGFRLCTAPVDTSFSEEDADCPPSPPRLCVSKVPPPKVPIGRAVFPPLSPVLVDTLLNLPPSPFFTLTPLAKTSRRP